MEKFNFQNGVTKANADTFNKFQDNINEKPYLYKITTNVSAGAEVTIPCYYKVGQGTLDVYLNGERLFLSSDTTGTNGHYLEVGTTNDISNKIKTTTDWSLETGDVLGLIVRGEYSNDT